MKHILRWNLACMLVAAALAYGWAQPNLLQEEWMRIHPQNIPSATGLDPFPEWRRQEFWQAVPETMRAAYIREAERVLELPYPMLPATLFLEFQRTGNRERFQELQRQRRDMLYALVLAECFERKGRFLDKIADGIWAICEETYWGVPAHLYMQKLSIGLPDVTEPTMDLLAGETVALLAVTYHLLEKDLNTVSPLICQRLLYEADRRVLTPNLARRDFWWMSFDPSLNNGTINNWNPWCNSNWLLAVMLLEKDPERKKQAMHKIVSSLDLFLNNQHPDGGCDEGPSYWDRAGGSLFDALEMLYRYTNGQFNVFSNPLIQNVGSYIYKAHIKERSFVNFADAAARANISAVTVFMYGKRIENDTMKALAKEALEMQQFTQKISLGLNSIYRNLMAFGALPEMQQFDTRPGKAPFYWFPYLQVMVARKGLPNGKELFLAAQGGHNAESHNHNDVGNFIVYHNGQPVLIDIGVETYTAKTFSKDRYDIWTMQSQYHNVPTINGVQQKQGRQFQAQAVAVSQTAQQYAFSLDMAKAYPAEAAVRQWKRSVALDASGVMLTDTYELQAIKGETVFHFMTSLPPEIGKSGSIRLSREDQVFNLTFDAKRLVPKVEAITLQDSKLRSSWGERLYRISLTVQAPKLKDVFVFRIAPE